MKPRRFNWVISDIVRKGLKLYLEWSARLRGQRFHCTALAGQSEYNITINCDLTVSCNCQDYNGSGHIGDLNKNSFEDIFFGPVARRFRAELAKGKLPIKSCTRCGDLMRVPKSQVKVVTGLTTGNGHGEVKTPRSPAEKPGAIPLSSSGGEGRGEEANSAVRVAPSPSSPNQSPSESQIVKKAEAIPLSSSGGEGRGEEANSVAHLTLPPPSPFP